jgi:hypothetical protein
VDQKHDICVPPVTEIQDDSKRWTQVYISKLELDILFVQTGNSNDKCSSSLEVECWNEDETHAAQQSPTVQTNTKRTLHSSRPLFKPTQNARCTAAADCSNQHKTHAAQQSPTVQTNTKRTLHSSRRFVFNELTNAKNLVLHSSHFALNWRCCTAVRYASALAVVFENLGPPLLNVM